MALKFNTFRSERFLRSRFLEGRYLLAAENTDIELELIDFSRRIVKFAFGNIALEDSWKTSRYSITTEITNKVGNVLSVDSTLLDLVAISDEVFKNNAYVTFVSAVDPGAGEVTVNNASSLSIGDTIEIKIKNTLLVESGEAWYEGFPFVMTGGKDYRVSGSNLAMGTTLPVGGGTAFITAQDEPAGLGKLITFSDGGTTPTGDYRIVIGAREEVITDTEDPFLKNANVPESTGQKLRVNYRINVVPEADQDNQPVPYTGSADGNLVNEIEIIAQTGANGSEVSRTVISGSEQIDGRNLEIIIRNDSAAANPNYGGTVGNLIPTSISEQQEFNNGKFIDSVGSEYHLNTIFNDTISTQVVLRVDKDVDQPDPVINDEQSYKIIKKDTYVTDDVNGNPQGILYWPVSTIGWNSALGFTHDSKVTDLRSYVVTNEEFQEKSNIKFGLRLSKGGDISFDVAADDVLQWDADFVLVNPYGPEQTIAANTAAMVEGGSLVYTMDLDNGGAIDRSTQAVTISSVAGNNVTLAALTSLENVRVGNVIKRDTLNEIGYITDIDDTSNIITLNAGHTFTNVGGAATIYLDSFGPELAPVDVDKFTLAVRSDDIVYVSGTLKLEKEAINQLGRGLTNQTLTYIGATDELDSDPNYTSITVVTQGGPLPQAISELDAEIAAINALLATPAYDERILYPTGLASLTTITIPVNSRNGGAQETYDPTSGELEVYVNGRFTFQDEVWESVSTTQIRFFDALPNDTEVHVRKDTLGGTSGGGGGSNTLQDAYNVGTGIITTIGGKPFTVGGAATKVAQFNGDIGVTGVVDPTGVELVPQATTPLGTNKNGIWIDSSDNLIIDRGTEPQQNITQSIEDLESGISVEALVRSFTNISGGTITKGTPVYSPTSGQIDLADGDDTEAKARIVGVAAEDILPAQSGLVAYAGTIVDAALGFTHGEYLYLSATAGTMTDTKPTLGGGFPAGFHVVKVGIVDGDDLILQPEFIGNL